jgi:hypothetical protein
LKVGLPILQVFKSKVLVAELQIDTFNFAAKQYQVRAKGAFCTQ